MPGTDVQGEFKGRRQAGIGSRNDLEKWTAKGAGTVGIQRMCQPGEHLYSSM